MANIVAAVEARIRRERAEVVLRQGSAKGKALSRNQKVVEDSMVRVRGPKWKVGEEALAKNMSSAVADSTGKVYAYWWGRFEEFCKESKVEPMKASVDTVMMFLSFLAENSSGQGGVKGARAALQHYFVIGGRRAVPTEEGRIDKLIRGIERRFSIPVQKSAAMGKNDLLKFLQVATAGGKVQEVKLGMLRLGAQVKFIGG